MEQLNRFRLRHRPRDSLAAVEMRWEYFIGTGVLPSSLARRSSVGKGGQGDWDVRSPQLS
jgi:hypothetical protein